MTRIHTSLDELVGNTPLLELVRFCLLYTSDAADD